MVSSNWKITYDPTGTPRILVNYGGRISDELEIPWSQSVQDSPRLRAASMNYFGRGNVANGLRFGVFNDHADDATARAWMLALVAGLPTLETKTLKIEINGGAKYLMSQAVIRAVTPRMVINAPVARTLTQYEITGGGWAVTT